jgi:hypothetical protein
MLEPITFPNVLLTRCTFPSLLLNSHAQLPQTYPHSPPRRTVLPYQTRTRTRTGAEPRAVRLDWNASSCPLVPCATLSRSPQLPPAPEELCRCCSGYYCVDDMTPLLREMTREAIVLHGEDAPVYVFLSPGPRRTAYGLGEGYRNWLGRAAGEGVSAGRNRAKWTSTRRRSQREEMAKRSHGDVVGRQSRLR